MRHVIISALAILAGSLLFAGSPAEAKPGWKGGKRAGYGGPPPWAPAYGYRRKRAYGGYGYGGGPRSFRF